MRAADAENSADRQNHAKDHECNAAKTQAQGTRDTIVIPDRIVVGVDDLHQLRTGSDCNRSKDKASEQTAFVSLIAGRGWGLLPPTGLDPGETIFEIRVGHAASLSARLCQSLADRVAQKN